MTDDPAGKALERARLAVVNCASYLCPHTENEECAAAVNRYGALAEKVGRLQQVEQDCTTIQDASGVFDAASYNDRTRLLRLLQDERDRLRRELESET